MSLELPFGLKVINPLPVDDKYLSNGVIYNTISQVNSEIPITIRHIGLTVNINNVEYWYKDGISDTDLVIKSTFDDSAFTAYTATTEVRLQGIETDVFNLEASDISILNNINDIESDINYISGITNTKQDNLSAGGGINSSQLNNDIVSLDLSNYIAPSNIILNITGSTSDFKVNDGSTVKRGVEYTGNYHSTYSLRSLVDKEYVDNLVTGLSAKNAVLLATTESDGNINLSSYTGGTIDGTVLTNEPLRVLIKNQTNTTQNGIYVWDNNTSSFTRADDFDEVGEITSGSFTTVASGNTLSNSAWIVTSPSITNSGFTEPILWSVFAIPSAGIKSIENVGIGHGIVSGITVNKIAYLKSLTREGDIQLISNNDNITIKSIYTGSTASTVNLGGISSGYVLTNKTFSQILKDLLSPALNPTLVAPSNTFVMSPFANNQNLEVGSSVNITFTAGFSRGSISPQYPPTLESFRSGLANTYNYSGVGLTTTGTSSFTNIQSVNSYSILLGANNWTSSVSYDAGVQPYNSAGDPYLTALPAGTTGSIARTLNGIYPYFYGKVASGGAPAGTNRPIATNSLVTGGTKVVGVSTGTITITFGATSDDYLWFAIPSSSTSKTKWYVDALNSGTIGGTVSPAGNLFPDFDNVNVTTVLWAGIQYKVYISNYQTATVGAMEMRNS